MGRQSGIFTCRIGQPREPLDMKTGQLTARDIVAMKRAGQRIAALTAYDYTSAQMIDAAGVPLILIGDSLGTGVQGSGPSAAVYRIADAKALELAGAFAIVLELVPAFVAQEVSQRIAIPTIGIGSGPGCDGEIQVFHDLFGLYTDFLPRHTRRYLNVAKEISTAARQYAQDVSAGRFPGPEQTSDLDPQAR